MKDRENPVTLGKIVAMVTELSLEDKKILLEELQNSILFNQ